MNQSVVSPSRSSAGMSPSTLRSPPVPPLPHSEQPHFDNTMNRSVRFGNMSFPNRSITMLSPTGRSHLKLCCVMDADLYASDEEGEMEEQGLHDQQIEEHAESGTQGGHGGEIVGDINSTLSASAVSPAMRNVSPSVFPANMSLNQSMYQRGGFNASLTARQRPSPIATKPAEPENAALNATMLSPRKAQPRMIFIDWIRAIAVYAVVVVHIFVSLRRSTFVSHELDMKIDGSIRVVLQYGMPIFFYFSGRSAAFGKKGFWIFFVDKLKRLGIPLVIGLFVVVIPANYIGRSYRPCADESIDSFFEYYKYYMTDAISCTGVDWYWFLPVLFVASVIDQYFLKWVKDRYPYTRMFHWELHVDGPPLLYLFAMTIFVFGTGSAIDMPPVVSTCFLLPFWLLYLCVMILPFLRRHAAISVLFFVCPVPSLLLAYFCKEQDDYAKDTDGLFGEVSNTLLMLVFLNYFYIDGFIDTIFDFEWKVWIEESKTAAALKPTGLLFLIIGLAACMPTTSLSSGYLYNYPMFKESDWSCVSFVLGTWLWLVIWIRYGETFYNEIINEFEYTHVTTSSMLVYLIHWLFIDIFQLLLVEEFDMSLEAGAAILIPLVFMASIGTYALLYNLPRIIACVKRGCRCKRNDVKGKKEGIDGDGDSEVAMETMNSEKPEPVPASSIAVAVNNSGNEDEEPSIQPDINEPLDDAHL
eukprot:PhM_4_TR6339/c0_g1_i1/m.52535